MVGEHRGDPLPTWDSVDADRARLAEAREMDDRKGISLHEWTAMKRIIELRIIAGGWIAES